MDRSYLSQTEVIKASRAFVCVRLATYEDEKEAAFLKNLFRTRSGELENSVFTVLSSDGKRALARTGRGPSSIAWTASGLAGTLNRISREHPGKSALAALPTVANVKLAINVAACDNLPLVVLHGSTAKQSRELETQIAKLAWKPPYLGRFIYVVAEGEGALKGIPGGKTGLTVVQPNKYGTGGSVLAHASPDATEKELSAALVKGMEAHVPDMKTFFNHVREGHKKGIYWETPTPVTDPMEKAARERGKRKKGG